MTFIPYIGQTSTQIIVIKVTWLLLTFNLLIEKLIEKFIVAKSMYVSLGVIR